jgi:hypothetical protein
MTARRMRWLALLLGFACVPALVRADVHRQGDWPGADTEHVSLSFSGPRAAAIRSLAEAAGWSMVSSVPGDTPVDIDVKDQPAGKVLELLLADGDYWVKRDGSMLAISPSGASAATAPSTLPSPPPMAAEPARPERGEDRVVTGSSVVIRRDETVGDLSVFGGAADIYGNVTGDIAVFGGPLRLHPGSHVHGDIAAIGGAVTIEDGARVDGDVSSTGGPVRSAPGAFVSGQHKHNGPSLAAAKHEASSAARFLQKLSGAIARAALLFAFGSVLLALAAQRMELLQLELDERPMRAFALGALGVIAGAFGLIALCVTIIGIPVAIIVVLLGVVGVYAGICAAFTLLGARLLRHHTENPYLHLALGCALYLVLSSLPVVGWLATGIATLIGLGLVVSTRAAGLLARHDRTLTGA